VKPVANVRTNTRGSFLNWKASQEASSARL
jgi:hypothetical protein